MNKKLKVLILSIMLLFPIIVIRVDGQILQDTTSVNQVKKYIDYVYNLQFIKAAEIYRKIFLSFPDHPGTLLLNGLKTYWENYPLLPTSPACSAFEADLRNCIQLSERNHPPEYEAEYLLTDLCARGFLLLFYSENELNSEVFPLATSTYQYLRRSFEFTSVHADFFFFTGMYNYYREEYPKAYPAYEALAFLFPKGDRLTGLHNLKTASEGSIFLKAESFTFLSLIFLSFENNFLQASYYSKSLHDLYPENLKYRADYIKNLLLVKKYDEAEKLISPSGPEILNSFYKVQFLIFNGILQEKKYHDYIKAKQFYDKGAREISRFGDFGNEFAAYCYFGLSRISNINGDKQYTKVYRKQALKLADFKKVNFDE
jgi:hypothetical protein